MGLLCRAQGESCGVLVTNHDDTKDDNPHALAELNILWRGDSHVERTGGCC